MKNDFSSDASSKNFALDTMIRKEQYDEMQRLFERQAERQNQLKAACLSSGRTLQQCGLK